MFLSQQGQHPKRQKKGDSQDYDNFDKMVAKYKNKIMNQKSGNKWFE